MAKGIIKKIVRASLPVPGAVANRERIASEGYGIIRTSDGREVYFLNAAVEDSRFEELHQGQTVKFELEEGSLGIATSVTKVRNMVAPAV
jgi:cold shock CspA family protein